MPTRITRAFTLLLAACVLTTCSDDDSSSSNDDRGNFGEMADVLHSAEAEFLTAYADIFASAKVMKPYVLSTLSSRRHSASIGASGVTPCFPEGIAGLSFIFDGASYVGVEDSSLSDESARFQLCQLSEQGAPQSGITVGYLSLTCIEDFYPLIEIETNSTSSPIASIALVLDEPGQEHLAGRLRAGNGTDSVRVQGNLSPELGLCVSYGFPDSTLAEYCLQASVTDSATAIVGFLPVFGGSDWRLLGHLTVDGSLAMIRGYQVYRRYREHGFSDLLATCIYSGTIDEPDFAPPNTGCFDGEIDLMLGSPAQLQAISDSYRSIRAFWLTTANLVEICESVIPANRR